MSKKLVGLDGVNIGRSGGEVVSFNARVLVDIEAGEEVTFRLDAHIAESFGAQLAKRAAEAIAAGEQAQRDTLREFKERVERGKSDPQP